MKWCRQLMQELSNYLNSEVYRKPMFCVPQNVNLVSIEYQQVVVNKSCAKHRSEHHNFMFQVLIQADALNYNVSLNRTMNINLDYLTVFLNLQTRTVSTLSVQHFKLEDVLSYQKYTFVKSNIQLFYKMVKENASLRN